MNKWQYKKLELLFKSLDKVVTKFQDNNLNRNISNYIDIVYWNIPLIFPKDWIYCGFDVVDKQDEKQFYTYGARYFGITELEFLYLFFDQEDSLCKEQKEILGDYKLEKIIKPENFKKNIKKLLTKYM